MQEFDHVAGDVECNHDCSCRVTVCIAGDFKSRWWLLMMKII